MYKHIICIYIYIYIYIFVDDCLSSVFFKNFSGTHVDFLKNMTLKLYVFISLHLNIRMHKKSSKKIEENQRP